MDAHGPRLVLPEAVELDLPTANLGSRMLAFLLDWLIIGAGILVGGIAWAAGEGAVGGWLLHAFFTVLLGAWPLGYFMGQETLWRGRTVGKAAAGLRVVTREGGPVGFRHAAIRALLLVVDFLPLGLFGAVGGTAIAVSRANQRLGDMVAGTLVLRERTAAPVPTAVEFTPPWGLEGYAAVLDTSALRSEEYEAVRSLLVRYSTLRPDAAYRLAYQLAEQLRPRVRPGPPPRIQPDDYLRCIAAAYQRRQRGGAAGGPRTPGGHVPPAPVASPSPGGRPLAAGFPPSQPPARPAPADPQPPAAPGGLAPPG